MISNIHTMTAQSPSFGMPTYGPALGALIAEHRPTSAAALLRISGVGPAKLERYGDGLLAVVG